MHNKDLIAQFKLLNPHTTVIDLARPYYEFIAEIFFHAILVANRFHVNREVTEALQDVRIRVSLTLTSESRKYLKRHKRLLGKRFDSLGGKEEQRLGEILSYSKELTGVYAIKESLIDWYELSNESDSYRR